ncbi:DUF4145 domain-containing protein [Alcaligenes nematophilus]|uniref:DUF4145 domain-containing protein n=1 Tax=Alcaligenes nematophilus TaxID=2994643 RepID=UPI0034E0CBF7
MTIFTHDCPKCGVSHAAFRLIKEVSSTAERSTNYLFLLCPKCSEPITVKWHNPSGWYVANWEGDILDVDPSLGYVLRVEPPPLNHVAPPCTPENVAAYYVEALDGLHRQKWTSAASLLRKCLEVSLKAYSPEIEAWKLEKRIDKLASENKVTPALKDWAHELRLDGNEALHGDQPADEELATRMERLTYFLLTYLYTLPAQVAAARELREQEQAE